MLNYTEIIMIMHIFFVLHPWEYHITVIWIVLGESEKWYKMMIPTDEQK